ncbi:uncharacterized protein LOC131322262 isoform X2 [Rhododendron vialii]|uniref:uncharacterized protein LOC131322262 isoform X2 n=1 Tax=Rhododendron vialii TaxID=182163 RepID=UPI00265F9349|nr:uncharacterized protein LOC131322262 isoform X2 [Rhododendron vialii]
MLIGLSCLVNKLAEILDSSLTGASSRSCEHVLNVVMQSVMTFWGCCEGQDLLRRDRWRIDRLTFVLPLPTWCIGPPGLASCTTLFVGSKASISTQSMSSNEPVVSVDWLHANLKEPDMKVLDASWYMTDEQKNPLQEYKVAHIPGALFFDVDGISDQPTKPLVFRIKTAWLFMMEREFAAQLEFGGEFSWG